MIINQQLGSFEVPGRHPHIVFLLWMIELGQTPVDQSEMSFVMIDHHIVWFHIPVHDSHWMAIIKGLEQFIQIISDLIVRKSLIQLLKITNQLKENVIWKPWNQCCWHIQKRVPESWTLDPWQHPTNWWCLCRLSNSQGFLFLSWFSSFWLAVTNLDKLSYMYKQNL